MDTDTRAPESWQPQLAAELREAGQDTPPDFPTPDTDHGPRHTAQHLDRWCPGWRDWTDPWQETP